MVLNDFLLKKKFILLFSLLLFLILSKIFVDTTFEDLCEGLLKEIFKISDSILFSVIIFPVLSSTFCKIKLFSVN